MDGFKVPFEERPMDEITTGQKSIFLPCWFQVALIPQSAPPLQFSQRRDIQLLASWEASFTWAEVTSMAGAPARGRCPALMAAATPGRRMRQECTLPRDPRTSVASWEKTCMHKLEQKHMLMRFPPQIAVMTPSRWICSVRTTKTGVACLYESHPGGARGVYLERVSQINKNGKVCNDCLISTLHTLWVGHQGTFGEVTELSIPSHFLAPQ